MSSCAGPCGTSSNATNCNVCTSGCGLTFIISTYASCSNLSNSSCCSRLRFSAALASAARFKTRWPRYARCTAIAAATFSGSGGGGASAFFFFFLPPTAPPPTFFPFAPRVVVLVGMDTGVRPPRVGAPALPLPLPFFFGVGISSVSRLANLCGGAPFGFRGILQNRKYGWAGRALETRIQLN